MIGRMILRMALVNALTYRKDDQGQYPTIAGERVFDTRLVPVQLTEGYVEIPVAMVYSLDTRTSDDRRERRSTFSGVNFTQRFEIEIQVATYESVLVDPEDKAGKRTTKYTIAENDADLAAVLDMFEAQVWRVLHDPLNPWSVFWASSLRNARKYDSELEADGEKNNRYALRRISLDVDMCPDPLPKTGITDGKVILPPPPAHPDDFVLFAGTYLEDVIKNMAGQADSKTIFDAIRSTLGGDSGTLLPRLKRIGVIARGKPIPEEPEGQVLATMEMDVSGETDG